MWRYTIDLPPDEHGQRHQRTRRGFERKLDASRAMRAELHGVDHGIAVDRTTLTVAAYLGEWIAGIRVRPTTKANYETCIYVHLIPTTTRDGRSRPGIGGLQLQSLRAEHLDRLYRYLEVEGKRTKDGPGRWRSSRSVMCTPPSARRSKTPWCAATSTATSPTSPTRRLSARPGPAALWMGSGP